MYSWPRSPPPKAFTSSRTRFRFFHLLIEAQDGFLKISASNIEQTLTTKAQATVKKVGVATVPARSCMTTSSCCQPATLASSYWATIGSEFRPAAPTPRWSAWRGTATRDPHHRQFAEGDASHHHTPFLDCSHDQCGVDGGVTLHAHRIPAPFGTDQGLHGPARTETRLALAEKDETLESVTAPRKLLVPYQALHDLSSLLASTKSDND